MLQKYFFAMPRWNTSEMSQKTVNQVHFEEIRKCAYYLHSWVYCHQTIEQLKIFFSKRRDEILFFRQKKNRVLGVPLRKFEKPVQGTIIYFVYLSFSKLV